MKFLDKLQRCWNTNNSLVCVGLDPDLKKIPEHLRSQDNAIFEFNRHIIDATCDLVCAYKPQAAYYAGQDADDQLQKTIAHIKKNYPHIPVILDVKRGDIGSTAEMYAKEAFVRYAADAVTVNPYMGFDTLCPFLDHADKGVVVLCRTSNASAIDLQDLVCDGKKVFEHVAELAKTRWNYNENVLLVVGATFPQELAQIRQMCPDMPFLVPGIGAQGGDLAAVLKAGLDANDAGLIINSSRGIIYASDGESFAQAARQATLELRYTINLHRK